MSWAASQTHDRARPATFAGLETQSITEVHGEWRTGKTQLCHTLCVTCQLPVEAGGAAGKAAYIDTEGTFRPEKIAAIADRFGLDANSVLENITTARAYTYEQQNALIDGAAAQVNVTPSSARGHLLTICISACSSRTQTSNSSVWHSSWPSVSH